MFDMLIILYIRQLKEKNKINTLEKSEIISLRNIFILYILNKKMEYLCMLNKIITNNNNNNNHYIVINRKLCKIFISL